MAAGLDVYEEEPANGNNPLLKLTNVVTLPHAGSATHETRLEMAKLVINDLHKIVNGIEPKNLIK